MPISPNTFIFKRKPTVHVETCVNIHASKETVWRVLSDLQAYGTWNIRTHFDQTPTLNVKQVMRVKLFGVWLSVPVIIQTVDINDGLRWQGGITGIYTGSHYFKIIENSGGGITLYQGEDFHGIFVPLMWPFLKRELNGLYVSMNVALKKRCEHQSI